jgi:hypothetical protein
MASCPLYSPSVCSTPTLPGVLKQSEFHVGGRRNGRTIDLVLSLGLGAANIESVVMAGFSFSEDASLNAFTE